MSGTGVAKSEQTRSQEKRGFEKTLEQEELLQLIYQTLKEMLLQLQIISGEEDVN